MQLYFLKCILFLILSWTILGLWLSETWAGFLQSEDNHVEMTFLQAHEKGFYLWLPTVINFFFTRQMLHGLQLQNFETLHLEKQNSNISFQTERRCVIEVNLFQIFLNPYQNAFKQCQVSKLLQKIEYITI